MSRLEKLAAYTTGEMSDADADAFEAELFDAPDDPDLALLDRIVRHGEKLVAHGTFDMGVPRAHIDTLRAAGHNIHIFDAGPPSSNTVSFPRDAQFIVTKLHVGRTDLDRVDVEITLIDRNTTKTIKDVLVDQTDGVIYGMCERPLAEIAFAAGKTLARVRRRDGARDVIGEWHFTPA